MATTLEYDKYIAWVKLYEKEEPTLGMIHQVKKDNFPDIGFGFASGDGMFNDGFILFLDDQPSKKQDDVLEDLAAHGNFVMATNDWRTAQQMTLTYLKHEAIFEDERFLPDDVCLS